MSATRTDAALAQARHSSSRIWIIVAAVEATAAAAAVVLDLVIPSLVLLAMAGASLVVRRTGVGSLGFARSVPAARLAATMLGFAAVWSLVQLGVVQPIANHASGQERDVSGFANLQGNLGLLLTMLALGWVLGALVEETAFRGYLLTRLREALGSGRRGLVAAVILSSVLFGVAHTEQGVVGVLAVTVDGIAFSLLRYRYRTLWAPVLAHGFLNTIGFVTFFLVGPVGALW